VRIVVKIGSLELGKNPCVAAVVDEIVPVDVLVGLKRKGVDLLEIRVDLIDAPFDRIVTYLRDLRSVAALPMRHAPRK
jgi:hypothetical protein